MFQLTWGFDGTSNQSQYNQKFAGDGSVGNDESDANLLATTVVPLRMADDDDESSIIWNNATPQSLRWCRPLRLQFKKETKDSTIAEKLAVDDEVSNLTEFNMTIAGLNVIVRYQLYLSMIDGKVLANITDTKSYQTCCICKANPKDFNNLSNMSTRFKPQEGTLKFGISPLHLWIRFFETSLHLSYRLPFQKPQLRGIFKVEAAQRKLVIQKRFFEKMGRRVDYPSVGGSGNSNSGPVARKAFSNPKVMAEILELDEDLIDRFHTILVALSCQLPLDVEKFSKFCEETATVYVQHYKWCPMSPTVHKVLVHSGEIMLANELPLGILAEDASESANKLYRHNREFHARKSSREKNLTDVFNRSLDSSDPIIASYSLQKRLHSRVRKHIPLKVLGLLKPPELPYSPHEPDESEASEHEEDDEDDFLSEIWEGLDHLNLQHDPFYN